MSRIVVPRTSLCVTDLSSPPAEGTGTAVRPAGPPPSRPAEPAPWCRRPTVLTWPDLVTRPDHPTWPPDLTAAHWSLAGPVQRRRAPIAIRGFSWTLDGRNITAGGSSVQQTEPIEQTESGCARTTCPCLTTIM